MKQILSEMYGMLEERAIIKGMKSPTRYYDFGEFEIKCWVDITEESVKTTFYVQTKSFQSTEEAIYKTNSFKELREWLQKNIDNIS